MLRGQAARKEKLEKSRRITFGFDIHLMLRSKLTAIFGHEN
jgi:hypothetical protein